MPDFWDDVRAQAGLPAPGASSQPPGPTTPQPNASPTATAGGDFWDDVRSQAGMSSTVSPAAPLAPVAPENETWWQKHGREVEGGLAAGAAFLLGPKIGRAGAKMLGKTGVVGDALATASKNTKAIIAPSTVDEAAGRAAGAARQESGVAARDVATTTAKLEPMWKQIGGANERDQRQFISYVEGRSKGARLNDPRLSQLADTMRDEYAAVHKEMGQLQQHQKLGFIEDYYRHQWVKDEASDRAFTKEGMGYFTKERKIPTIEEGIRLGLKPRTLDPVQTTLEYITNARRFMATNRMLETGKLSNDVYTKTLGSKAPFPTADKWVPLEGALARKGGHQLYAKEGWARVYNNFIGTGFTGAAGDVVHAMRRVSNTMTAFELGLSGFHATTMVNEAIINDVAKAISQGVGGDIAGALKSIALAPTAPVRLAMTGHKLEKVYLGQATGNREMRKITDLLTKAGGRAKGMLHAKDYEYTAMGSFMEAWKKGAIASEFKEYGKNIVASPITGTAKTAASLIGRTMQTVMEPLFKTYIPKLKNGAFYDTMAQWLKANPYATKDESVAMARVIWDSIDNRFGEAVNDNIFWKQHMKQVAMLSMRSYSWNVGTIREIGGGLLDAASHKMSPRVAYTIALPIVYGTIGALYQYLKTGEAPKDTEDLVAPRTGGTDAGTGLPERMIMPGYMKDVFGWQHDPVELAKHKMSTFVSTAMELASGKDWRGDPIRAPTEDPNAPFEQTAPPWLKAYFAHVAAKYQPISFDVFTEGRKRGTNISIAERMGGLQPAGRRYVDPQGSDAMAAYRARGDWQRKQKYEYRQKSYRQEIE